MNLSALFASLPVFALTLALGATLIVLPDPFLMLACAGLGLLELLVLNAGTCLLPGSIFMSFMYVLYLAAPALVRLGGYDQEMNYQEISPLVTGGIACLVVGVHVVWRVAGTASAPLTAQRLRDWAEHVDARWLWGVTAVCMATVAFLIAIGAGKHLAGEGLVETPFRGATENLRTLIYSVSFVLGIKLAARPGDRGALLLMLLASAGMLGNSLYSGRKEDFAIHLLLFLLAFFACSPNRTKFALKVLLPVVLCGILFVGFMYRLRSHPVFHGLDKSSSVTEILTDTITGRYVGTIRSGNPLARFDLLEPTSRYFTSDRPPMYDLAGKMEILKVQVLPRVIWPDKPILPPDLGFMFSQTYGYSTHYGQTSTAFGYLVESHFWFGWPGLIVMLLLPMVLDWFTGVSLARREMHVGRLWLVLCLGVFIERTLLPQLIHIGVIALLIDGLWRLTRVVWPPPANEGSGSFRKSIL